MAVDLRTLPKAELHLHLDGCPRVETVAQIGAELGLTLPDPLELALVAPEQCADLAGYLHYFELFVQVMQRPEHLRRISFELVEDLAADGVTYAEVRFAPQLHTRMGMSLQEVLDSVTAGLAEGSAAVGVQTGVIVCCLRHQEPGVSLQLARLAADNTSQVCAVDLAGDEARYSARPHLPAFELAREAGLHRIVHAGEAAGPDSVREALDVFGAERIGHGVRIADDPSLVARVRAENIAVETCPRSNVQTRAARSLGEHSVDRLLRQGAPVTVSTDARTVSNTTLTREFLALQEQFGWGVSEVVTCQTNALRAAFMAPVVRDRLLRELALGASAA